MVYISHLPKLIRWIALLSPWDNYPCHFDLFPWSDLHKLELNYCYSEPRVGRLTKLDHHLLEGTIIPSLTFPQSLTLENMPF